MLKSPPVAVVSDADLSTDNSKFKLGQKVCMNDYVSPKSLGSVVDIYAIQDDNGEILYKYEINTVSDRMNYIYSEYELDFYEDHNDILKRLVNG